MNSFEIQTENEASLDRQREQQRQSNNQFQIPNSGTSSSGQQRQRLQQQQQAQQQQQQLFNDLQLTNKFKCQINHENVYSVYISCIEIYNNYIYDLLDDCSSSSNSSSSSSGGGNGSSSSNQITPNSNQQQFDSKESKNLKEDTRGSMYIKDVNELEVKSIEEALELMSRAQKRRVVAHTDLNSESSRSHSIFTIRIVQTNSSNLINMNKQSPIHVSQLSLVDLAGSERTKRTKNTGSRLREAGSINSSLMALRNCMETLRENSLNGTRKMVPYRDSKLTLLFKNYFEGNGKTKMILCINPNSIEFDETFVRSFFRLNF